MLARASPSTRDARIDLLRGLSLLSIFVDHIPKNRLADFTFHSFAFSDAAEIFVILAGFSASVALGRVFERDGLRVGFTKVFLRCLQIYGVQVLLLLLTLLFVAEWDRLYGMQSIIVGPMLRDGWHGTMRGMVLAALPSYLDILPLYILLLGAFPLIRYGLMHSIPATVAGSVLLYGLANVLHWNLPNIVDPADAAHWYFDPFTWQLIFVLGCWLAISARNRHPVIVNPPPLLIAACWAYVVFAFVALDAWKLWPAPFGPNFPGMDPPFAIFGNEPKTFVTPWRLINVLAITYLALTSPGLATVARGRLLGPVVACGRHSLYVFALGCILALFGRMIYKTYAVTTGTEVLVNVTGLSAMLLFGVILDGVKAGRPVREQRPGVARCCARSWSWSSVSNPSGLRPPRSRTLCSRSHCGPTPDRTRPSFASWLSGRPRHEASGRPRRRRATRLGSSTC